jgi:serine/threonine protein kinase
VAYCLFISLKCLYSDIVSCKHCNRTGFEEDKNFHVVLNSVIAGRYHVTEYLGSAAFSKAIQAHDLHTGMDVCVKIIKNNKDFFDQSLDEIKLLKYVNKHDPADKYHLLRLYDYFYYRVNMCFYLLLIPFDVIIPMKHRICHLSTLGLTDVISLILLKHFP